MWVRNLGWSPKSPFSASHLRKTNWIFFLRYRHCKLWNDIHGVIQLYSEGGDIKFKHGPMLLGYVIVAYWVQSSGESHIPMIYICFSLSQLNVLAICEKLQHSTISCHWHQCNRGHHRMLYPRWASMDGDLCPCCTITLLPQENYVFQWILGWDQVWVLHQYT